MLIRSGKIPLALLLALMACSACRHPMQVFTTSKICAETIPVRMDSGISVEMSGKLDPMRIEMGSMPLKDESPLSAMLVAGGKGKGQAGKLALIDVDGLLINENLTGPLSAGENPVDLFREKLAQVADDGGYKGVVLRINSPGGGVTACDIMRRELVAFKSKSGLPVVACLMDLGTGGAYYLASAADRIVAHPTSLTGGIGVILNLYNLEDALNQFNVVGVPVKAGKNIDLGTPIHPLGEEQRELLQQIANDFHERFRKVVLESREGVKDEDVFDGRILTATQARKAHLIDQVGYLDDAILAAGDLCGTDANTAVYLLHRPRDKARSVYSITPNQPLDLLGMMNIPGADRSRLPTFLYLWQPDPKLGSMAGR